MRVHSSKIDTKLDSIVAFYEARGGEYEKFYKELKSFIKKNKINLNFEKIDYIEEDLCQVIIQFWNSSGLLALDYSNDVALIFDGPEKLVMDTLKKFDKYLQTKFDVDTLDKDEWYDSEEMLKKIANRMGFKLIRNEKV